MSPVDEWGRPPLIYAAAVIKMAWPSSVKQSTGTRLLPSMAIVYFFVLAIFDGSKAAFYLVHLTPLLACCAAIWIGAEWSRGAWRRAAAAGVAALLIVLQVGWIGYGIRRDSYRHAYLPAAAYLKQNAGPHDLVFAASEFAFQLGFYNNLRDDSTLGYFTGKRAAFIVVDGPGYGEAFKGFAAIDPRLDRFIRKTLTEDYRKVYSGPAYEIYARR